MLRAENRAEREAKKKAQRELEQEGLPVFDCDFTCGFDDVENDQTARPSYFMDTTFNRQADLWCSVQGRSMLPDLEPGDKIALRRVTIDNLEPGHIYAVVLDGLRTVKILRRVPEDPTMLDFVASNPEYGTERYPIQPHFAPLQGSGKTARVLRKRLLFQLISFGRNEVLIKPHLFFIYKRLLHGAVSLS